MKDSNKLNLAWAGILLGVTAIVVFCTGCPFSPNVDQIRADFCAEYPEVCQYVDFD